MEKNNGVKRLYQSLTKEKNKDVGLVFTAVLLLFFLRTHNTSFIFCSLALLVVSILFPLAIKPFSFIWYGLAEILGMVVSRVLLTVVFFLVITPIGFIKRVASNEYLLSERWKKDTKSLFIMRDKLFSATDIENPF